MKKRQFDYSKLYYPTPKEKRGFYISASSIKLFIFLVIIGGSAYFVFFSSFFRLRNIFYEGDPAPQMTAELDKLKDSNVLFISAELLKDDLNSKYAVYKNIDIYKGLPDSIKVILYRRNRSFIWESQSKYYSVDDDGVVYEEIPSLPTDNQTIVIKDYKNLQVQMGQRIAVGDFIKFVDDVSKKFNTKTQTKITELGIEETTYHLHIKTEPGWRAMLDTTRNLDDQLDDLTKIQSAFGAEINEYVDLRIVGRAYYK